MPKITAPEKRQARIIDLITKLAEESARACVRQKTAFPMLDIAGHVQSVSFNIYPETAGEKHGFPAACALDTYYFSLRWLEEPLYFKRAESYLLKALETVKSL